MSVIRTLFQVADVALTIKNTRDIHKMNASHEQIAVAQAQVQLIREIAQDYLLRINSMKEELLFVRQKSPLAVAAGLLYLEHEINNSGLSVDMFDSYSDKEAIISTERNIRLSRVELTEQFDEDQLGLVETTARALIDYKDINFIVETYPKARELKVLQKDLELHNTKQPRGLFNSDRKGWRDERDRLQAAIQHLKEQTDVEELVRVCEQHNIEEFENSNKLKTNIEELIQSVFGHQMLIPQLSIDQVAQEKMIDQTVNQLALESGGGTAQYPANSRKTCPKCGHENSKHRVTCKECKTKF